MLNILISYCKINSTKLNKKTPQPHLELPIPFELINNSTNVN